MLLGVVTLALMSVVPVGQSAQADSQPSVGRASALTPTAPPQGRAWIQGLVRTQGGQFLDGVDVQAFPVGTRDSPAASALTYADPDTGRAHGYYRLYWLKPGFYELQVSSLDGLFEPVWTEPVRVRSRQVLDLAPIVVSVRPQETQAKARLSDRTIRKNQTTKVLTRIRAVGDSADLRGTARLQKGKKLIAKTKVTPSDSGEVRFKVKGRRLGVGVHKLVVVFRSGSEWLADSRSGALRLRVAKQRPNAR